MWLSKSIAEHSVRLFFEISVFTIKKFNLPFILFTTFSAKGSPDILLPNKHPRYVTCKWCFTFTCLYLIFSWQVFLALHLLAKIIDLVLSSWKCTIGLLSPNQSQIFPKSLLSCFSISSTFLCWYKMQHLSAYNKSIVDLTACGLSFSWIKNKMRPKIDPCVTPQELFPKLESFLSVLARNICSKK